MPPTEMVDGYFMQSGDTGLQLLFLDKSNW